MKTLYHATQKENVFNIMQEGIKPSVDGLVYFCESIDDCSLFINLYHKNGGEFAFIPIEFNESEIKESFDHNPEIIKCRAWSYEGTVTKDRVPFLDKIPLYEYTPN